ncbi:hypothetical protein BFT35_01970 [Thermoanaerobacterium thermosaccharolyticum]|uniref:hypothetical protein n=1 Tax=Thermoanaerobacterium thermosaccharolyticum TaxID=1517 RepID=UPI000C0A3105|nr:hypothetical protein [Thermoanaerobacterium thermosaccharolyticum]PHO08247.1 hypothetical protein BFT35_01970 [Thermoanaerobacterium thermosaccharolyticum]
MGKLLHAEWYKFIHDKIFFITCAATVIFNLIVFSGSPIFTLTGHSALVESMKKEIATAILSCIYGGIFLGGDFAERTLYHGITSGNGRGRKDSQTPRPQTLRARAPFPREPACACALSKQGA